MKELQIINDISKDRQLVNGRELHEFLEVKTQYTKWIERMCEYGFEKNEDYILDSQKRLTNNPKNPYTVETVHHMTIDMAKEICMIQRSEKGKQARKYFLEVEKAWNSPEKIMARALQISKQKINQLEITLQEQQPHVNFAKAIEHSADAISIGDFAKLLANDGIKIGRNKLFAWLRDNGYLITQGRSTNIPKQKYVEQNLFSVKESVVHTIKGDILSNTTLRTGKGQMYFLDKMRSM